MACIIPYLVLSNSFRSHGPFAFLLLCAANVLDHPARLSPFTITDEKCLLEHYANHIFVSNKTSVPSGLCVPQKNGNIFWSQLLYRSLLTKQEFDRIPIKNGKKDLTQETMDPKLELQGKHQRDRLFFLTYPTVKRYMVVRNPYVRFLSGYIDKIQQSKDKRGKVEKQCKMKVDSLEAFAVCSFHIRSKMSSSFMLENIKDFFVRHIFAPQSLHCLLPCGVEYTYLRLEESHIWYPALVTELGLESAISTGWGDPPCFMAYQGNCNYTQWRLMHSNETTLGRVHAHDSLHHLLDHYTPSAAYLVTKMFVDDIVNFNYPFWNGTTPVQII